MKFYYPNNFWGIKYSEKIFEHVNNTFFLAGKLQVLKKNRCLILSSINCVIKL